MMNAHPASNRERLPLFGQIVTALTGGVLIFLSVVILWVLGYQLAYAGLVFPGVSVAGVDVSGLSPEQAGLKLSQSLSSPLIANAIFRDATNSYVDTPR